MSLFEKIKRYSVFYFVTSICFSWSLHAKVFDKDLLQNTAMTFVTTQIDDFDNRNIRLSTLPLDDRIPDRSCSKELELSTSNSPTSNRQVTVQIKCNEESSWTQYVHVRVEKMTPIVIVKENVAKGEVITYSQLTIEMKPAHFVRAQYLTDPDVLIGSRSKRNIRSGMPVLLNQICMVCKGDAVNIYASIKGLRIKTTGIALEDGTLGDQVQIKNKKSGKILNARVDGVESVQVNI